MTLHEALKSIPGDTLLKSTIDGKQATAGELLTTVKDERGYAVEHGKHNYGKDTHITIYAPGAGILYYQV